MKFELEPYHHDVTKEQVVADIIRVARDLKQDTITMEDYKTHGKFSTNTARRRCGSWLKALAEASLSHSRPNLKISPDHFIPDIQRVAQELERSTLTTEEYQQHGRFSPTPIMKHFGSWFAALDAAGLDRSRTLHVSDEDYFENLERIWVHLGRQPRLNDIQKPFSKYSSGAYVYRFGSWRKALKAFIAFVNNDLPQQAEPEFVDSCSAEEEKKENVSTQTPLVLQGSRHISWRLRFLVMRRDDFKCQCCGNSPALSPGLILHVDHVHPWSKGGRTTKDNLQTLCEQCNIGKSDLPMEEEREKANNRLHKYFSFRARNEKTVKRSVGRRKDCGGSQH